MAKMNKSNAEPLPLTPEEMKAIGEIELGPSRHEQFLNNHYKKLIVGLVVFMLLASGAIVYATWRAHQEADSAAALVSSMKIPFGKADAAGYDSATLEKLLADYPATRAAASARLMLGMQLLAGGQQQRGLAELEQVAANAPEMLSLRAKVVMAGHYTDSGDMAKAQELWQAVSKEGANPWEALALLNLGDISAQLGEVPMAKVYYSQIQERCPNSPLVPEANSRLLLLGVDAPVPVAPEPEQPATPAWQPSETGSFTAPTGTGSFTAPTGTGSFTAPAETGSFTTPAVPLSE